MNIEVISNALAGSPAGTNAFPDVVRILTAEGVESYRADLVRLEETFYMPDGTTHVEKRDFPARGIGEHFYADQVVSAIRASQAGKSKYPEFLNRVMDAGTTSYVVYLSGGKAIYFGRKGTPETISQDGPCRERLWQKSTRRAGDESRLKAGCSQDWLPHKVR